MSLGLGFQLCRRGAKSLPLPGSNRAITIRKRNARRESFDIVPPVAFFARRESFDTVGAPLFDLPGGGFEFSGFQARFGTSRQGREGGDGVGPRDAGGVFLDVCERPRGAAAGAELLGEGERRGTVAGDGFLQNEIPETIVAVVDGGEVRVTDVL